MLFIFAVKDAHLEEALLSQEACQGVLGVAFQGVAYQAEAFLVPSLEEAYQEGASVLPVEAGPLEVDHQQEGGCRSEVQQRQLVLSVVSSLAEMAHQHLEQGQQGQLELSQNDP